MNHSKCSPSSAASTLPVSDDGNAGNGRVGLQPTRTALGAGSISSDPKVPGTTREFVRTVTFRLLPMDEDFKLLRLRDAQAAQYMNRYSIHLYCQRHGFLPPVDAFKQLQAVFAAAGEAGTDERYESALKKLKLTSVDHVSPGDLSGDIYVACQKRVRDQWQRIGKRIWSAVQIPTFKKGCLPFDGGGRSEKGGSCGIRIVTRRDGGYAAELHVTAAGGEGEKWIEVPLGRDTDQDRRRENLAAAFAAGTAHVLNGYVRWADENRKTLLTVAYKLNRFVPKMGSRVVTLSELEDGRLLLRGEFGDQLLDFSSKLHAFRELKKHRDGIQRRFSHRSMRSKGSARRLRRKLASFAFNQKTNNALHQWSAEMVKWAVAQGCGRFVVAHLIGGDWPAHLLKERIKYKAEEAGLTFEEPNPEQAPTERAVQAIEKKRQRQAKKLGDAMREIVNNPLTTERAK